MLQFEKRNGKAYLYFLSADYALPRVIASYWEIDIDASILPDHPQIIKIMDTYVARTEYREYPLVISQYPTFTEFYPIKPPRKRGYVWKDGEWRKSPG